MYGHGQHACLFQQLALQWSGMGTAPGCLVITGLLCLGGVQHLAIINSTSASSPWLFHSSAAALLVHCFLGIVSPLQT